MKTNREIREESWKIVRGKWFWRIFTAGFILYAIIIAVSLFVGSLYVDMSIETWQDFLQAKVRAMQSGLGYAVPSRAAFWQMTGASAFQQFISCIFGAIISFGMAGLLLKAARNQDERWFAGTFEGFKRPLEVAWLMVIMNLKVFLWSLLLLIPGWVAVYRYRQAWYLKSENPDWSAAKCIAESSKMMDGHKKQAFWLDIFYLGWMILAWMVFGVAAGVGVSAKDGSLFVVLIATLLNIVSVYFFAFILAYFFTSRAIFYRELACAYTRDMV